MLESFVYFGRNEMTSLEEIFYKYGLTMFWCVGMAVWFLQTLPKFKTYVRKNPFGDYEQSRTSATLGVLGTFFGITVGLFLFDTKNIQESVEKLLGGMTTAFVTSIIGMLMSIWFKNSQANYQKNYRNSTANVNSDANISDLIKYLQESDAEKNNLLNALKNSLVGDGEYTVVGQIKMIRFDINEKFKSLEKILQDNNKEMLSAFENFAQTLAENNSKIFIEALNETMRDFNKKLSEQFGENFKQLNIAVGKLLEWQENYKQTLETVTENLQVTFEGIDAIKNSVTEIEKSSTTMIESSQEIQKLIVTADFYSEKLSQVLQKIKMLSENANESLENLNEKMVGVTENATEMTKQIILVGNQTLAEISEVTSENMNLFNKVLNKFGSEVQNYTEQATENVNSHINLTTENLNEKMQATLIKTNNMTATINSFGNTVLNKISQTAEQNISSIDELSKNVISTSRKQREIMDTEIQATKENVEKSAAVLRENTFKITKKVSDSLETMMKNNNENLKTATDNLNKNLQETLNKSLEEFGHTMYLVSQKFVDDYTPLTEKLQKLVQIAEVVRRR